MAALACWRMVARFEPLPGAVQVVAVVAEEPAKRISTTFASLAPVVRPEIESVFGDALADVPVNSMSVTSSNGVVGSTFA